MQTDGHKEIAVVFTGISQGECYLSRFLYSTIYHRPFTSRIHRGSQRDSHYYDYVSRVTGAGNLSLPVEGTQANKRPFKCYFTFPFRHLPLFLQVFVAVTQSTVESDDIEYEE